MTATWVKETPILSQRMKKVISSLFVAAALSACSFSPATKGVVLGPNSAPVPDAFVIYGFKGQSESGFWGGPWADGVTKTNELGEFNIPFKIHMRLSEFARPPYDPIVFVVYSPTLHGATNVPFEKEPLRYHLNDTTKDLFMRWKCIELTGGQLKLFYAGMAAMSRPDWRQLLDALDNEIKELKILHYEPIEPLLEYERFIDSKRKTH